MQGEAVDHTAQARSRRALRPLARSGTPEASAIVTAQPRSSVAQGQCAAGLDAVRGRAPDCEGVEQAALAAVGVHDVAARGRGRDVRGNGTRPGAELTEPERARPRPPRAGPLPPTWPRGWPRGPRGSERPRRRAPSLLRAPSSPPSVAAACPGRGATGRGGRRGARLPRRSVSSCVRKGGRAGVVGAVAIAEEGERPQEIPLVAPLRSEARKRLVQRVGGPFAIGWDHARGARIAGQVAVSTACTLGGCVRHRRLGEGSGMALDATGDAPRHRGGDCHGHVRDGYRRMAANTRILGFVTNADTLTTRISSPALGGGSVHRRRCTRHDGAGGAATLTLTHDLESTVFILDDAPCGVAEASPIEFDDGSTAPSRWVTGGLALRPRSFQRRPRGRMGQRDGQRHRPRDRGVQQS